MTENFQWLVDQFTRWGEACDSLYCAVIVGSQARSDHKADEFSDLDLILIVEDPGVYISTSQWLGDIGSYHISFTEKSIGEGMQRRVLFDNALDVDFMIFPKSRMETLFSGEIATMLERGYYILIDKIGMKDSIVLPDRASHCFPEEGDFINIVHDFWYHSVWTVKKLKRGEIWAAKSCLDSYMKQLLLSMIEVHARSTRGLSFPPWHDGRFVDEWAEEWIVEKLGSCFSLYNEQSIENALLSTMDLYRAIALEVAGMQDFKYPDSADEYATTWVVAALRAPNV